MTLATLLIACSGEGGRTGYGGWQGTVHTEGSTTTVRNLAGSVWDSARLIEEASIGDPGGEDAYVFSRVRSVAASDDRIYVLDELARAVRIYDMAGQHISDIGHEGDGPGEFRRPWALGLTDEGTLMVRDRAQGRIHVLSLDGELLGDWRASGGAMTTMGADGTVYMLGRLEDQPQTGERPRVGMWAHRPDGRGSVIPIPYLEALPQYVPVDRSQLEPGIGRAQSEGLGLDVIAIPFAPYPMWVLGGDGTLYSGSQDSYQFEARRLDGSLLRIERQVEPVPVLDDEGRWHRGRLEAFWRELIPGFVWRGATLPGYKRAVVSLIPDHSGRVWVIRETEGQRLPDCDPDPADLEAFLEHPCWHQPYAMDAFGPDGRFLGSVALPDGVRFRNEMYIRDDLLIAVHEDPAGTIRVKRYRLEVAR